MADATGSTPQLLALYSALAAEPYRFGFVSLLRLIEASHPQLPRLGSAATPRDDPIRLAQQPSMIFAPSTLAGLEIRPDSKAPRLEVFFLGLFGPNGPLPIHLTEYARSRARQDDDPTFAHFADMFHHRLLSLFYRAATIADPSVNYDRPTQSRYRIYLGSLLGIGTASLQNRDLWPDTAKLHFSGRLSCQPKNPEGLMAILQSFFQVPTRLREFVGAWLSLPHEHRCRLGRSPETGTLGLNVIAGSRIWSGQQKFALQMGPMTLADYRRFLPDQASLARLVDVIRNYSNDEFDWELNLILARDQIPQAKLGTYVQLGWTSWLAHKPAKTDAADLTLHPVATHYSPRPSRSKA